MSIHNVTLKKNGLLDLPKIFGQIPYSKYPAFNLLHAGSFFMLLLLCLFSKLTFTKNLVQIWVQTVCKVYQQPEKVATSQD